MKRRAIQLADALTLALLVVALFAAFHPINTDLAGVPIQIRTGWRPLLEGFVVSLIRHRLVPSPSLWSRLLAALQRTEPVWPALRAALVIGLTTRLLVLFIGYFSVVTFGLKADAPPAMGHNFGAELPLRWDAGWYLGIVHRGYRWTGRIHDQQNLNFFPGYPLTARYAAQLFHFHTVPLYIVEAWTATAVSILAFLAACTYLHRLVAARYGSETAAGTLLLLATYPFALFYSAVYPEALFLLCAVGAWYHVEHDQPLPVVFWGVLAGLTRPNGGLLAIPLAILVLVDKPRSRRLLLVTAAPIVGTLAYSAWAYRLTGHPFVWAELQREAFMRSYRGLDETLWTPIKAVANGGILKYVGEQPWELTNLAAAFLALGAIWPVTSRLGLAPGAFVAIAVLVPLFNGGLVSMGRYTSVLFPIFIWLALALRVHRLALTASCFALFQGILAGLFFTWRPIF